MKGCKKLLFVVFCMVCLVAIVGASGKQETDKAKTVATGDIMAKYSPAITVTTVAILPDGMQYDPGDTTENNFWTRAYERDLGIKIKYQWAVPASQGEQKMNVAIASNDLPDIIPASLVQFRQMVVNGVAQDITKMVDTHTTQFTKTILQSDKGVGLSQVTVGGKVYALPNINGNIDAAPMLWLRADWLKTLGLNPPKTMDELVAVLRAFVTKDPDGNGKADTVGLILDKTLWGGFCALEGFFAAYHAYPNTWVKDASGKAAYGSIQPEVKTALVKLAALYKEGLIDAEFVVKDSAKNAEITTSGRGGVLFGQHWIPFWPLQSTKDTNPSSDWKPFAVVSADAQPAKAPIHGSVGRAYIVNKTMQNPEAAFKIFNYGLGKECGLSPNFEPEYHADGARKYNRYQYMVMNSFYGEQNIFIHRGVVKYLQGDKSVLENYWIKDNLEQITKFREGDNAFWMTYSWSGPEGAFSIIDSYDKKNLFYQDLYVKAPTEGMADNSTTLSKMQDEVFTKIIMGKSPIEEFDIFVANWKKLGGDQITKEVNDALK